MDALAAHQASMNHKHDDNRMHLKHTARAPHTKRYISMRPAIADPPSHGTRKRERSRDRRALEVLALARRVLGQHGDGHVEAREAGQAAEDEEGEEDVVEGGADAEGEGGAGGGDAEGDLSKKTCERTFLFSK